MSKIGKKAGVVIVVLIVIAIAVFVVYKEKPSIAPTKPDLTLSNYPELFKKDVVIVIGENATQTEMEGAQAIAENLGSLTGNVPVVKKDIEVTDNEKAGYNMILVGRLEANKLLRDVYEKTKVTKVTAGYPGTGKGVLEILKNPWNEDKAMLLVAGSDELGMRAGENELSWMVLSKIKLERTHGDIQTFTGALKRIARHWAVSCKDPNISSFYLETESSNSYPLTNINPCSGLLPGEELVTKQVGSCRSKGGSVQNKTHGEA
jgi:hypothetical protein